MLFANDKLPWEKNELQTCGDIQIKIYSMIYDELKVPWDAWITDEKQINSASYAHRYELDAIVFALIIHFMTHQSHDEWWYFTNWSLTNQIIIITYHNILE